MAKQPAKRNSALMSVLIWLLAVVLFVLVVGGSFFVVASPLVVNIVFGFNIADISDTKVMKETDTYSLDWYDSDNNADSEKYINSYASPYTLTFREAATVTTKYILGKATEEHLAVTYSTDSANAEASVSHLRDVRGVVRGARTLCIVLLIAAVALVGFAEYRGEKYAIRAAMKRAAVLCIGIPAVLGIVVALAFEPLFTAFHGLFFAAGTWQFPSDSLLITLFPLSFWVAETVMWVVLVMVIGCVMLGISCLPVDKSAH